MGGSGRTQLIQLRAEKKDFAALSIGILALSGALYLSIFNLDRTIWRGLKTIL
jgi:hypothetical protein